MIKKVYAIKPLTFMNRSGVCIKELIEYFKIDVKMFLYSMMIWILILEKLK